MTTMAATFQVFVEGATDASPLGLRKLAEAMASHYGLPPADLMARLGKGRFRVKGNIDRATAEQYVAELARLGARATMEDSSASARPPRKPAAPKPAALAPK